jgi:hypothetical protein
MEKTPAAFAEPLKVAAAGAVSVIVMLAFASVVQAMTSAVVLLLSVYVQPEGVAGAAVSFVTAADVVVDTFPAASADHAEIETAPSEKEETLRPLNVTVPAPDVALAVRMIVDVPLVSVSVTWSLASEPPGSETLTDSEPALPELTYALPLPPPFASEMPLGWFGGVASAVAVAVVLSRLSSVGVPLETARTL